VLAKDDAEIGDIMVGMIDRVVMQFADDKAGGAEHANEQCRAKCEKPARCAALTDISGPVHRPAHPVVAPVIRI
jgi:hypothetical protein